MRDEVKIWKIVKMAKFSADSFNKRMSKVAEQFGLNSSEIAILMFFYDNPTFSNAKDIVCNKHVSKAYVSKALNLLLEKKLVNIVTDNLDKRYQKITINNSANKIIDKVNIARENYKKEIIKNIDDSELNIFFEVLSKIEQNIMNMEEEN